MTLYNEVLKRTIPSEVTLTAFADDVAVVAVARNEAAIQKVANDALKTIEWFAAEKSEAVMLTEFKRHNSIELEIGNQKIKTKSQVKCFGVSLYSTKDKKYITVLCRLLQNPRIRKRDSSQS